MFTPASTLAEAQDRLENIAAERPNWWPPFNVRYAAWKHIRAVFVADYERLRDEVDR